MSVNIVCVFSPPYRLMLRSAVSTHVQSCRGSRGRLDTTGQCLRTADPLQRELESAVHGRGPLYFIRGFGSESNEQMERSTLEMVSAGLQLSLRMSKQMAPLLLMLQ